MLVGLVVFIGFICMLAIPIINSWNHQRKITIELGGNMFSTAIDMYVPSYLFTNQELQNTHHNEIFTNTKAENSINLFSLDKRVNKEYYQINGVDLFISYRTPMQPYTENIPFAIAQKTTIQTPSMQAVVYLYPGADGSGHGRGKLGSVHQGQISLDATKGVGLTFYCYDHSSVGKVSQRCEQTVNKLITSAHVQSSIFNHLFPW